MVTGKNIYLLKGGPKELEILELRLIKESTYI
jgi:hypothetical protein